MRLIMYPMMQAHLLEQLEDDNCPTTLRLVAQGCKIISACKMDKAETNVGSSLFKDVMRRLLRS